MNRTIKFRFYDPDEKKMSTSGMEVDFTGNLCVFMGDNECPLMQFTGLLDKNGKEIYEGDIVLIKPTPRGSKGIYSVVYESPEFQLAGYDNYDPYGFPEFSWDKLEIIGNVFEHPSLLSPHDK